MARTTESLTLNILWSDPVDAEARMGHGVHGRGAGIINFSENDTKRFCEKNKLQVINCPPGGSFITHKVYQRGISAQ